MTDTQAPGWRHPEQHLARRVEKRTPAEMMNLLTLYLVTALGDRYAVRVADDGSVIGLWRRS